MNTNAPTTPHETVILAWRHGSVSIKWNAAPNKNPNMYAPMFFDK